MFATIQREIASRVEMTLEPHPINATRVTPAYCASFNTYRKVILWRVLLTTQLRILATIALGMARWVNPTTLNTAWVASYERRTASA